jgi:hypothetical protein
MMATPELLTRRQPTFSYCSQTLIAHSTVMPVSAWGQG